MASEASRSHCTSGSQTESQSARHRRHGSVASSSVGSSIGEPVQEPNPPSPTEEAYSVERILAKRDYEGCVYYKLKWAGYAEPSWEREDNCHCDLLIEQYEQNLLLNGIDPDEDEDVWEVQEILDKRIVDGDRVEYLVRWKGWPGPPSWERAENCDCINLIATYENPKLRKLLNFKGNNIDLWLFRDEIIRYMKRYKRKFRSSVRILKFEPDFPADEAPLAFKDGLNIGPLCYENHWYLVIVLQNHICVTRRMLACDPLNTLIGVNTKTHPIVRRLQKVYRKFQVMPVRMTQMNRSDMCAYYILAAFERALFIFFRKAHFVAQRLFFEHSKPELIRNRMKPRVHNQISVTLPIPEGLDHGPMCEFCESLFDTQTMVNEHIKNHHMRDEDPLHHHGNSTMVSDRGLSP